MLFAFAFLAVKYLDVYIKATKSPKLASHGAVRVPSRAVQLFPALGPVSRNSRNFTGHFQVTQFPLYLKNGEDLSRQTSQSFFSLLKDRLSKTSGWQFHKWLFGPEKCSGLSRNGPLLALMRTALIRGFSQ